MKAMKQWLGKRRFNYIDAMGFYATGIFVQRQEYLIAFFVYFTALVVGCFIEERS